MEYRIKKEYYGKRVGLGYGWPIITLVRNTPKSIIRRMLTMPNMRIMLEQAEEIAYTDFEEIEDAKAGFQLPEKWDESNILELRDYAKSLDYKGYSRLSKEELVEFIRNGGELIAEKELEETK